MIDQKYLCDYTINIPIFTNDPTNRNICEYLFEKDYRHIILYCNSRIEGQKLNILLNQIQNGSSEFIDCETPKTKRNNIILKYKNGKLRFLVNVRILVEGFDSPITRGICFMHMPTSTNTIIQIMGRALRLHPTKVFAKIILPFSSKEDESSISHFLKVIAKNDNTIRRAYEEKRNGDYISISYKGHNNDQEEEIDPDIKLKYEFIYDSLGILKNNHDVWFSNFQRLKEYIDLRKKLPAERDKNKELKQLATWVSTQKKTYRNKSGIMKDDNIFTTWTEFINHETYSHYFSSAEEKWFAKLSEIKDYIDKHKALPSRHQKENQHEKVLGNWIKEQRFTHNKKIKIMKDEDIYNKWTEFINDDKYINYFFTNEEVLMYNFTKVKNYISLHNKRPQTNDSDTDTVKLATWIHHQIFNYKRRLKIMSDSNIYSLWSDFIQDDKYSKYFQI